jgi:arabinofuranan 3-O-arabinosyltransferase
VCHTHLERHPDTSHVDNRPQPKSFPFPAIMSGVLGSRPSPASLGIENRFFTEQRILVCASAAAISYAIGLVWLIQHGLFLGSHGKQCVDFTSMWVTGSFAGSSDPARMYDDSAWSAAWKSLTGLSGCMLAHGHTSYPPTLLFFTYPLGLMPYSIAFAAWVVVTLLLYLVAVWLIIPRRAAVIAALTPFTVPANILIGHNGFLTAGLIGLSLVFLERRPRLSGVFLGILTYKPHFGILFPFALFASRNWRALASATLTTVILTMTAEIAFGYEVWPSFISSLFDRNSGLIQNEVELNLQSIYGLLHWAGTSGWISWTIHLAFAVMLILVVCALSAKPLPYSLKAAILCVASVSITPYVFGYDLCILSIAVAFLVKDGMCRGFLPGERMALLACWWGLILITGSIPALICIVLLVLVLRRAILCGKLLQHLPRAASVSIHG